MRLVLVLGLLAVLSALGWWRQSGRLMPPESAHQTSTSQNSLAPAPSTLPLDQIDAAAAPLTGRGDLAEFAPRHTRSNITLAAYFESQEPLPPGVQPLPEYARNVGPDPRLENRRPPPAERLATGPNEPVPLFNGRDLSGWEVHEGKLDAWQVADGVLKSIRPGGGWLRTTHEYSDFELRLEFRITSGANTGIGLRLPAAGNPTIAGMELQLIDDDAPKYAGLRPDQQTGSFYYHIPPLKHRPLTVGEWHTCRIIASGSRIRVLIDEEPVNDVRLDQLPAGERPHPLTQRPPQGRIGLQSSAAPVEFRNILLKDFVTEQPSGLQVSDLVIGSGAICRPDSRVTIDYVGGFLDGRTFDSSFDRGEPVTIALSEAIEGWQIGIPGMKVGGRRKLIVPASLGYGDAGVGNLIPPGATLVFEVELRAVAD